MGTSPSKTVSVQEEQHHSSSSSLSPGTNNTQATKKMNPLQLSESELEDPSMFRVVSSHDEQDNDDTTDGAEKKGKKDDVHKLYRILALEGDSGCVFCRVHGDMQKTIPRISEHGGTLEFATRTILRMKNITVARQLGRDRSMFGPLDYLDNLEEPEKYLFTIELPKSNWPESERFPKFKYHPRTRKNVNEDSSSSLSSTSEKKKKVSPLDCVIVDAVWISGKKHPDVVKRFAEEEYKKKHGIERVFGFSVFPDPGILELSLVEDESTPRKNSEISHQTQDDLSSRTVFDFPVVDATSLDLSDFKCRVLRNDVPFQFLAEGNELDDQGKPFPPSYWPRPVTYNFQPKYAHEAVYGPQSAGLFLETHDFTQSMTPANPDSNGFIVVGRWMDGAAEQGDEKQNNCVADATTAAESPLLSSTSKSKDEKIASPQFNPLPRRLQLIALRIPYGWTIIIDKQCIHGDTTFSGLYAMSMTTDHVIMGTADTVFIKHAKSKKNIDFSCPSHYLQQGSQEELKEKSDNGNVDRVHPVRVREGIVVYKDATREELEKFDRDTSGASFILQPFSKLSWTTTMFRRFGWYPGIPSPKKEEINK